MKKHIFLLFSFLIFSCLALSQGDIALFSANAKTEVTISLKDETVAFSLEGYTPKATVSPRAAAQLIEYTATDVATRKKVSIPIDKPGTYEITAFFAENENYTSSHATSTVTIESVKARIITNYHTVAYSKMENPVSYSIEPSWAKEYLNIEIEYFPIEDLNSPPKHSIDVPIDLGLYYTVFNVKSSNAGIECENKYLVYEIAPYRGKKLPEAERGLSVPPSFTCTFEQLNTVYSPQTPIECKYTLSPAAIEGEIMYKTAHRDGTFSDYTKTPPVEPGEYICGYFLGGTCIGEGSIYIDKIQTSLTIDSMETPYVFGGVTPSATSETPNMDISFTAFAIDENGNVSMEETPVPITKAGKYSIIAYPADTKHYKRTYAYGYITITPATPEIEISTLEFNYDGSGKQLQVSVSPEDVLCKIEYFACDENGEHIPLHTYPTDPGEYMAVITAYDDNGNYTPVTRTEIMKITNGEKEPSYALPVIFSSITILIIIGVVVSFIIKKRKTENIEETQN